MRTYPIFLRIDGQPVYLLGDGPGAARRLAVLRESGADLRHDTRFDPARLAGSTLAFGTEAVEADLIALSERARASGIPVNIMDRPALCSFITPAIIDRGLIRIAISTGGAAPSLASVIRGRLEAALPAALANLAPLAEAARQTARRLLTDKGAQREAIQRVLTGRLAGQALAGDLPGALSGIAAEIHAGPSGATIQLLANIGNDADLVTIGAQRVMMAADIVIHSGHARAILDLARRDAHFVDSAAGPLDLRQLTLSHASSRPRITRLYRPEEAPQLLADLAALGSADCTPVIMPGAAVPT